MGATCQVTGAVTLTLSAKGIKVIDARGIDAVVNELIAKGVKL